MKKTSVAIFASGTGTNALKLLETGSSLSNTQISLLIVDRTDSPLPAQVREHFPHVAVKVITPDAKTKAADRKLAHETEILAALKEHHIEWIFLAGYMRILGPTLLNAFTDAHGNSRILNIHPSLLPAYPGADSYRRAFEANEKITGVTVHLVDSGVDTGPILAQRTLERMANDTLQTFTQRGKELEWKLYPEILRKLDREGTLMATSAVQTILVQHQTLLALPTKGEHRFLLFWVRYSGTEIASTDFEKISPLISDAIDQTLWVQPNAKQWQSLLTKEYERLQVIRFKPGVTDNPAHSFHELLQFDSNFKNRSLTVHSGEAVLLKANDAPAAFNNLIHESFEFPKTEINSAAERLCKISFSEPKELDASKSLVQHFSLSGKSPEELEEMSKKQFWALSRDEMLVIQDHYKDRLPTDVEMEVLAQTWSEHCKHKIFAAHIDYTDEYSDQNEKFRVEGLFKTYIAKPTEELRKKKDWAISVFKDNAGIVRFDDEMDICIKVETHNSPSALDPYGGALTGILGVNRDILGTGLGAKPIANTNVLLFGMPDEAHELPKGLLHPKKILEGVHKGIQDGGNKSGIPTINGAMLFDESFSGKPLVYCGTVGVLPQTIQGVPSASKNQKPGDFIVMVGGAVGADGLHGATSSSLALDQTTPSGMVQIGDPLTQKRVLDFIIEARDQFLYSSITDNGAGGLSSSIGEMSEQTNGAEVWLERVPLKYPGLLPWQIFISESQERMTLSVPKDKIEKLTALAKARGVDATVVGEFTNSGELNIKYGEKSVGKLSLKFLHDGLPKMQLKARWNGPEKRTTWKNAPTPLKNLKNFTTTLEVLLSDPSIASKEHWIRQYDHEVQSATVVKPFEGSIIQNEITAPNDGGLVWMDAHRPATSERRYTGAAVASGICPDFSLIDSGLMAKLAADEAVRNLVVLGCDPNKVALIDNFCWPDPLPGPKNPDAEHKLAQLVRTCRSLAELCRTYEMPLVSGKDSMKNDFIGSFQDGRETKISVLPTLLVTALGHHPDVRRAVKAHAKPGSTLYLLGKADYTHYFGTSLPKHFNYAETALSLNDWKLDETRALYENFFKATQKGLIQSAHDLSEGGLLVALFETLLLNQGGITFNLQELMPHGSLPQAFLFGENPGRILVSVNANDCAAFEKLFDCIKIGEVDKSQAIHIKSDGVDETMTLAQLEKSFRSFSRGEA